MDMNKYKFSSLKITSKPVVQEVADTKVLKFMAGDSEGGEAAFHIWGRYAELASKHLHKGQEIRAIGHNVTRDDGKTTFILERTMVVGARRRRVWNRVLMFKSELSVKLRDLCPFQLKTPEVPTPTKESLVDMILGWWEEERYEEVYIGDGEYDNMYDGEPDFVTRAREIKEEVIIE